MNGIGRIFKELKQAREAQSLLAPPDNKSVIKYLDIVWCIARYGALPEDYISLEFSKKTSRERSEYITSGNKRLFLKVFYDEEALRVLANKNLFNVKFKDYVKRDWLYTEDSTENDIVEFIQKHGEVVVKPINSTWGMGVKVIQASAVETLLKDVRSGNAFMIEEKLVNHPDIAKLNPYSLQTLRVETCLDNRGEFHLLNVLLMIGTKKIIVSNCHSGGVMCHVNMKTGIVDANGFNPQGWWIDKHPESGIKFIGFKIPHIEKLETYIRAVCKVMPNARYVGWDVAVTPSGFELIEGNFCPGQCTQTCDGVPKYNLLKSYM